MHGRDTMSGPQYALHAKRERGVVTTALKDLKEDDGVNRDPYTKTLVGHKEIAQALEAMWSSEHAGYVGAFGCYCPPWSVTVVIFCVPHKMVIFTPRVSLFFARHSPSASSALFLISFRLMVISRLLSLPNHTQSRICEAFAFLSFLATTSSRVGVTPNILVKDVETDFAITTTVGCRPAGWPEHQVRPARADEDEVHAARSCFLLFFPVQCLSLMVYLFLFFCMVLYIIYIESRVYCSKPPHFLFSFVWSWRRQERLLFLLSAERGREGNLPP